MFAAGNNSPEAARLLIGHGADVNAKSNDGVTALVFALLTGHKETISLLKK